MFTRNALHFSANNRNVSSEIIYIYLDYSITVDQSAAFRSCLFFSSLQKQAVDSSLPLLSMSPSILYVLLWLL